MYFLNIIKNSHLHRKIYNNDTKIFWIPTKLISRSFSIIFKTFIINKKSNYCKNSIKSVKKGKNWIKNSVGLHRLISFFSMKVRASRVQSYFPYYNSSLTSIDSCQAEVPLLGSLQSPLGEIWSLLFQTHVTQSHDQVS